MNVIRLFDKTDQVFVQLHEESVEFDGFLMCHVFVLCDTSSLATSFSLSFFICCTKKRRTLN